MSLEGAEPICRSTGGEKIAVDSLTLYCKVIGEVVVMHRMDAAVESQEQVRSARRRVSRRGAAGLVSMLAPAVLFPVLLLVAWQDPRFAWLSSPGRYPWELWLIAVCG